MKNLLLIFTVFICSVGFSQRYYFGDYQSRYKLDRSQYFTKNNHTISKPYLVSKSNDTLIQSGIWKYASKMNSSLFKILPVVSSKINYDLNNKELTNKTSFGAQFSSSYKDIFFTQFKFGFQRGELSSYESSTLEKRPFAPGIGYLNDSINNFFSKPFLEGLVSYSPNKFFVLSGGVGKHFLGDGYRSLWLSDYAPVFPFIKMESTFWKIKYINLWAMHDDLHTQLFSRHKWSSSHMLSLNVSDWLNLSLFESIVWQGQDTLSNRGFDINYVNPFVFFRPVEYGIGSADNSFLGAGIKVSFSDHYVVYGNFILDEFLLNEFKSNSGWWGNKYGFQSGFKFFDIFNAKGLYGILEWNSVRPYTYSHMTSMQNYGHQNHSLAHPLEANFKEGLLILGYQKSNFDFLIQYHLQRFGKDYDQNNYGGNIFSSYNDRFNNNAAYNHFTGQGEQIRQQIFLSKISMMLFPITNTKLFAQISVRNNSDYTSSLFSVGISSNLWQSYLDY